MQGASRISFKTWALGSCAALALATGAQAEDKAHFQIAGGDLKSALQQFARQSSQEVLFSDEVVTGKTTQGFAGDDDSRAALVRVLAGTGLTYNTTARGTLLVVPADPQGGSAGGGAEGNVVQELVVTAQKKSENIQVVPIAISAFTQQDLTTRQVAGGPDLMTQVPNMTFTKTNFSSYSIQIRGIGTQAISATTDAAVAVAFNNTPFIRNRFFEQEFYDLERVEVLRGPQGTLYGRNATAGVVNIISAKPTFDYQAKLSGDVANYGSHRLEAMVNLPLVDDKVALRLAGAWTKRDGYDYNQITGKQIDGRDLWSTRLSLRFAPTERIEANLIWEHFQEDDDRLRSGKQLCKRNSPAEVGGVTIPYGSAAPGNNNGMIYEQYYSQGCEAASLYSPDSFQAPNGFRLPYYRPLIQLGVPTIQYEDGLPFDPYLSTTQSHDLRVIESTVDPHYTANTDLVELQFRFNLTDSLTLASETGFLSDELFSSEDYNRFNTRSHAFSATNAAGDPLPRNAMSSDGVFCDPQIGCADRLVAVDLSTAQSRHFSQEFRLSSNYDGPFNFSLGANFLRYDTEDKYYVFVNTLTMLAVFDTDGMPNYVPGVTDNHECLQRGFEPPDPNQALDVTGCIYIDPNPIGSLNDMGHNYFLSDNPYKLISYAVFGEAYYNITDTLKLTAGLRWTVDKKEAPRIPSWVVGAGTAGYPVAEVIHQEWREPTGRITLDWKPDLSFTEQTLLYASYAHGYKAGGANPPASGLVMYITGGKPDWELLAEQQSAIKPKTFEPEFVNAFEIGSKNTLLDGRLTLNADAFYYDYKGYQISYIVDRSAVNLNFDAKVWGLELETDWRPLKNLRLGFKGGYENTRMADGSKAVDMMDRTAGHTDWYVTGPFPTLPSNCVLPTYTVIHPDGRLAVLGGASGGILGPCEQAYVLGHDPVTNQLYHPFPAYPGGIPDSYWYEGYPGFDPHTAPNGGAGFYKDLSGNELPNAPHFTATVTADYTIPLPRDWLVTLHSDLYYQSEAWTRVFNTPGYDRLKAYSNINVAAIFTNEAAGLKVMAYVKNVLDRDSITGAFLNSDDTGLTTNVFLTEPRLYGVRVTKEWNGGPWWTGAGPNHTGPYPLTVELSGQAQRHDAPYQTLAPNFVGAFSSALNPAAAQNGDLDWGDGRSVKLTYQPSPEWTVSAAVRYGRTNSATTRRHEAEEAGPKQCALIAQGNYTAQVRARCDPTYEFGGYPAGYFYYPAFVKGGTNWSDASAQSREEHHMVDFSVGREMGVGLIGKGKSSLGLGVRHASFESTTDVTMQGIPDWNLQEGWYKYPSPHHEYAAALDAKRKFSGTGPTLSWDAAKQLLGDNDIGHVDLDWSLTGGVLFGKQKTSITGFEQASYLEDSKYPEPPQSAPLSDPVPVDIHRSRSVTVPVLDLSVGLSYEIQRLKLSTGYRWERYFNVLDAGFQEHRSYDRTIDGPYFKVSVGFGG